MRKREPVANCERNAGRQGVVRPTCEKSSPTGLRSLRAFDHRQPDGHKRFAAAESSIDSTTRMRHSQPQPRRNRTYTSRISMSATVCKGARLRAQARGGAESPKTTGGAQRAWGVYRGPARAKVKEVSRVGIEPTSRR